MGSDTFYVGRSSLGQLISTLSVGNSPNKIINILLGLLMLLALTLIRLCINDLFREDSWKHFDAGSSGLKISDASEVLLVSKLRALSGSLPYAYAISKLKKHASVTFKQCSRLSSSSKILYFYYINLLLLLLFAQSPVWLDCVYRTFDPYIVR